MPVDSGPPGNSTASPRPRIGPIGMGQLPIPFGIYTPLSPRNRNSTFPAPPDR